ncbi:MAG: glycosyltransferase family protein [Myxococcota bacterium]
MRVLYGVVGEGMGHAIRSRVVLDHLVSQGHQVHIMASGRAISFLQQHFPSVHAIHGLHIISEDNRVRRGKTVWSNIVKGTAGIPKNIAAYFELLEEFRPEVVVSDFESWTYLYGKVHNLPVYSIDNMQIINRCTLPKEVIGDGADFALAKAFVKGKLPYCQHYFVTSFFRPPTRKSHTSLHPPILREEILRAESTPGEHLLVYQTSEDHDVLIDTLAATGLECRIYGLRRNLEEEVVEGDLRFRPFSEAGFIDDLRSARGVIASAGFTLMGEAVYLRKPMLAVPLRQQFEQLLNARYLTLEGYGRWTEEVNADAVRSFLDAIPACQDALAAYSQDRNRSILLALDEQLDQVAAGIV